MKSVGLDNNHNKYKACEGQTDLNLLNMEFSGR
jgi:hypothetical protein